MSRASKDSTRSSLVGVKPPRWVRKLSDGISKSYNSLENSSDNWVRKVFEWQAVTNKSQSYLNKDDKTTRKRSHISETVLSNQVIGRQSVNQRIRLHAAPSPHDEKSGPLDSVVNSDLRNSDVISALNGTLNRVENKHGLKVFRNANELRISEMTEPTNSTRTSICPSRASAFVPKIRDFGRNPMIEHPTLTERVEKNIIPMNGGSMVAARAVRNKLKSDGDNRLLGKYGNTLVT